MHVDMQLCMHVIQPNFIERATTHRINTNTNISVEENDTTMHHASSTHSQKKKKKKIRTDKAITFACSLYKNIYRIITRGCKHATLHALYIKKN